MNVVALEYLDLLQRFAAGSVSVEDFQGQYLRKFKAEDRPLDEETFQVLDRLFGDIEAFTPNDILRKRVNAVTRGWSLPLSQLQESVRRSIVRLEELNRELGAND